MRPNNFSLLVLAVLSVLATPRSGSAFIYPINEVIRDVFNNRKPVSGLLVRLRHEVEVREGENVAIDETIFQEGSNTWFRWELPSGGPTGAVIVARANGSRYAFASGGELPLVSQTWLRYVSGGGAQDFLDTAMREGFIRREQMLQFAPGYKPENDPKTWESNQHYLRHPDIYLHLIDGQPSIAVVGTHDTDRWRAVFFDLRRTGSRRLEWRNGNENVAWTFNRFAPAGQLGRFAREASLTVNGNIKAQTRVLSIQAVGSRDVPKEKRDLQASSGSSGMSTLDGALKVLLRYR